MPAEIALVAVENTTYRFDRQFSYLVPENMTVLPGMRVTVPFGKGNRKRQGIVLSTEAASAEGLKEISGVLDDTPILSDEMLRMVAFMKHHYFCTYYDAVRAMLPAGIMYRLSETYSVASSLGDKVYDLPDEWRRIVSYILSKNNKADRDKLLYDFGLSDAAILRQMCADGVLLKKDSASRRLSDKTVKMVRLCETIPSAGTLSEKQQRVLEAIESVGAASVREICYYTGVTSSVIDTLTKKGYTETFDDEVFRIPEAQAIERNPVILTEDQQRAYDDLLSLYQEDQPAVSLLFGVTGSGKTSVFFKLIERTLFDGLDTIVMVPEIALTPQLISLFKASFGDRVAVFHSALSQGERLDEYKRVQKGLAKIAVGTRSAIFAPCKNLGLIIMDEEQEHTYKSESNPRFCAKELAKFRCSYHHSLLLLSSATPSIESFYFAQSGAYQMQELPRRFGDALLPDVITVDMNEEMYRGNTSDFSSLLLEHLTENLEHGKQSILLLNRRGHNTYITCNSCHEPITCPNCSISMTYHSANNRLMCHYCGYSRDYTPECPTCRSHSLRFSGTGTQRAEAQLAELFPSARILRMDTDSTMSRSSHEKKLTAFSNGEYDILVGTQMVAKGLDFPNVTLVGVLNADRMLYLDDYRSYEYTFSLLTQVVGRSGRGKEHGRAIIQTYTPENPIIALAARQDYRAFYNSEIKLRRSLLYPPFASLCMVGFVSEHPEKSRAAAQRFMSGMTAILRSDYPDIPLRVLGPSEAGVFKVNNKYRFKLILKCRNDSRFREMLDRTLIDFFTIKEYADVTVYADMNPLNL